MRYVIDVTQLIHWPGNLTGIPRVMDELAIRFHTHNVDNVLYVSWVKELGEMCEVDFVKTRTHRGNGIDYVIKSNSTKTKSRSIKMPKARHLAKAILRKIAIKSRFDRTIIYKNMVSSVQKTEIAQYKIYTPKESDRLFIPWGEWWDQNWLNRVNSYSDVGVLIYPICHDVLPMVVPQFSGNSSSLREFVTQIFPISTIVLVPSKATEKDLKQWMEANGLHVPKIKIFRLGEDFSISKTAVNDAQIMRKYDIERDNYLIYVSTIEPRKNHTLLYYTYKLAASRNISLPKILIVGRVGHNVKEIVHFIKEDSEIKDLIKICDFVVDDELNWLYQNCMFTVVPSFYEGWGITVLESIHRGKPAICSNSSSLMEMPDDMVIRFNPSSTDECLEAIVKMAQPKTLKVYTDRVKKYKSHSWDGSFEQVYKILQEK